MYWGCRTHRIYRKEKWPFLAIGMLMILLLFLVSLLKSGVTPSSLQCTFEDKDTELQRRPPLLQKRHSLVGEMDPTRSHSWILPDVGFILSDAHECMKNEQVFTRGLKFSTKNIKEASRAV